MVREEMKAGDKQELATLAGGCFWCTEAIFKRLVGVVSVVPGYSGGKVENPTYSRVCGGKTGHAEAVQIKFDSQIISFGQILEVFFKLHDPTTFNRQEADVGTQYRSAIFYHNEQQKKTAEEIVAKLGTSGGYSRPIVTEIVPYKTFYPAENYHKDYYAKNSFEPYCRVVIDPKIQKLNREFKPLLIS